ncbi:MAG: hypothetical protein V3U65_13495 [Granulosicoccaceae bacterium]
MSADRMPAEFAKVQKVLDLRTARAKRQYLEKRAQYDELVVAADKFQKEVNDLTDQYNELVKQLTVKTGSLCVATLTDISDRRYWLNFDRELKQYYLDIAEADVDDAAEEMAVLKASWLKLDAREQVVEKMRSDVAKKAATLDEIKAELELSDTVISTSGLSRGC